MGCVRYWAGNFPRRARTRPTFELRWNRLQPELVHTEIGTLGAVRLSFGAVGFEFEIDFLC